MAYTVEYTKHAAKQLAKLSVKIRESLKEAINELAEDPFASHLNVTKLTDRVGFRLRVGDWRIMYELVNQQLLIEVFHIGNRKDVYR